MATPNLTPEQLTAMRSVPLVGDQPNRLKVALAMTGAKQVDLAEGTGMPPSMVSELVNGKYTNLHVETARRCADFFGCAIEDLFPTRAA